MELRNSTKINLIFNTSSLLLMSHFLGRLGKARSPKVPTCFIRFKYSLDWVATGPTVGKIPVKIQLSAAQEVAFWK
jgi:hypothetical protein